MPPDDPARPGPPPATPAPGVVVPHPEDLRLAHDDALLQLRIGRLAHTNAVVVSGVLLLDAILILYVHFVSTTGFLADWGVTIAVGLPALAAVYLTLGSLASKWSVFQLWPWERHFFFSVGAVVYSVGFAGVAALVLYQTRAPLDGTDLLWLFPFALLGITLGLLGLILTWSGWRRRQWVGLVASLLPLPVSLILYLPAAHGAEVGTALAIVLFVAATSYQTAGSMLHLIASGTPIHERELITSGQSRMFRLAHEIQRRERQVQDRESTAGRRETDTVYTQMELRRQQAALQEARQQLELLEADYRSRAEALARHQAEWVARSSEVNARALSVQESAAALQAREKALEATLARLSEREKKVIAMEGEQARREFDLTARQQQLDRREAKPPASPNASSPTPAGSPKSAESK
ncbi:MAG: hypothetical protein ACYCPN_00335 [Thermoplasmata archaeon]